ncbi:MAG: DEAD/DEAH box helicase family protein [Clostridia bacterium]|nr:DEAD/DEAH box helicase family protein [Clostridia bacterium]
MPRVILDWDSKYKKGIIISDFLENIRAQFSVPNKSKKMMGVKGMPTYHLADFISPITSTGRFDIGLYFEIIEYLKKDPLDYEVITSEPLADIILQSAYPWKFEYEIPKLSLNLRPYQESGVRRGIHLGYGILIVGTAGGKTLLMASLIQTIRKYQPPFTTLVILPSNIIIQTYKEFLGYGIPDNELSVWSGENDLEKTSIILASAETLKINLTTFRELKPKTELEWNSYNPKTVIKHETYEEYIKEFGKTEKIRRSDWIKNRKVVLKELSDVDLILIDEVHGLRRGNVINDALNIFPTHHRFGFTGTLPPDLLDQWNIIGNIGPIILDVNSAILREGGFVSQVKIQGIKINYKNPPEFNYEEDYDPDLPAKAYGQECEFLYHNEYRNKVISHISHKFDKNTLIIVDKIEHGEVLKEQLSKITDKKIYFIRGSVEMEDREKLRLLMEVENNIICIAMARIFAVGINIKNLHYVVFAQGGKAKVTLIQSIGRGLRLHENKECLIIIDIADATYYGERHLEDRLKYYKEEQIEYEFKSLYE